MTKSKFTKRALLVSVLSMMLCLTMLVGSTFAWFTDSVTSGKNKIVAGNLDVELEYATFNDDGSIKEWKSVEGVSLFDETALWEPGYTQVAYLRVRNAGSLALKYNLAVTAYDETPGINMAGESFNLSDFLVFGQMVSKTEIAKFASREAAWAAIDEAKSIGFSTQEAELAPGADSVDYVALVVYLPTTVDNKANHKTGTAAPKIDLGVTLTATQTPSETDSFGNDYDAEAYPTAVSTRNELVEALENGESVKLTQDVELFINPLTVKKDAVIDLNGHTLRGYKYKSAIDVVGAKVEIKNGTIEASPNASGSVLYAQGASELTVENCTIKSNGNQSFAVCTNGAQSKDAIISIRNSTIIAPTASGAKGYALYAPAGKIIFENCNVTGHIFISGGNVTLDGGIYTATGFNNQAKIWHKEDTITYLSSLPGGNACTMGDSILIADRRAGYTLSGVTIRNITFNTEIPAGTAYAIKYVDMNNNGAANRVNYVIENNTFNQQIDGKAPVMYIDLAGNDLANP